MKDLTEAPIIFEPYTFALAAPIRDDGKRGGKKKIESRDQTDMQTLLARLELIEAKGRRG